MYNLMRPHLRLVSKNAKALIIQDGVAYEHGSKKAVGKIADMKTILATTGSELCTACGGTYPTKAKLEEHIYKGHRDMIIAKASEKAPKKVKGNWSPSEEMLREEAAKLAGLDAPSEEGGEATAESEHDHREPA